MTGIKSYREQQQLRLHSSSFTPQQYSVFRNYADSELIPLNFSRNKKSVLTQLLT